MQDRSHREVAPPHIVPGSGSSVVAVVLDVEAIVLEHLLRSVLLRLGALLVILRLEIFLRPDPAELVALGERLPVHVGGALVLYLRQQLADLGDHGGLLRLGRGSLHPFLADPRNVVVRPLKVAFVELVLVRPEELVGVLAEIRRQLHHADRKPLLRQHPRVLQRRLDTGLVGVPDDSDPFGLGFQEADLLLGQCRSARCDGVLHSDLMQTAHVQVALHKVGLLCGVDLHVGLKPSEQDPLLFVKLGLSRVQVLRDTRLVADVPSREPGHIAARPEDGKHQPVPERVVDGAVILVPLDKPGGEQHVLLPAKPREVLFQPALLWSVTEAEQLGGLLLDPSSLQDVLPGSGRLPVALDEPLRRQLVHGHHL